MKKFLKEILMSLISGIVFVSVIIGVTVTYDTYWKSRSFEKPEYVNAPGDLSVTSHQASKETTNFTVFGVVKNSGDVYYSQVTLQVDVLAGEAKIGSCTSYVSRIAQKTSEMFLVKCEQIETKGLQENINYKVHVKEARL